MVSRCHLSPLGQHLFPAWSWPLCHAPPSPPPLPLWPQVVLTHFQNVWATLQCRDPLGQCTNYTEKIRLKKTHKNNKAYKTSGKQQSNQEDLQFSRRDKTHMNSTCRITCANRRRLPPAPQGYQCPCRASFSGKVFHLWGAPTEKGLSLPPPI